MRDIHFTPSDVGCNRRGVKEAPALSANLGGGTKRAAAELLVWLLLQH